MTTIKIYDTNITPERNAMVDNLDGYLASCQSNYNSTIQTQKIELEKNFVLSVPQDIYEPQSIGNYLVLEQISKKYYYFIDSYDWTSVNSCVIHCSMDTINTYKDEVYWSDKTLVNREHRSRYRQVSGSIDLTGDFFQRAAGSWDKAFTFHSTKLVGATVTRITYKTNIFDGSAHFTVTNHGIDKETGQINIRTNVEVFKAPARGQITFTVEYDSTIKHIDNIDEGITPVLYGHDKGQIFDKEDNDSWYVIYNTSVPQTTPTTTETPVETLLCKDTGFTTYTASDSFSNVNFEANELEDNKYYYINSAGIVKIIKDNFGQEIGRTSHTDNANQYGRSIIDNCFVFSKSGSNILVKKITYQEYRGLHVNTTASITNLGSYPSINISSDAAFNVYKADGFYDNYDGRARYLASPKTQSGSESVSTYISSINDLNRTIPTLIKIIKLPYCPLAYHINVEGKIIFDVDIEKTTNSELGGTFIRVSNNVEFGTKLDTDIANPLFEGVRPLTVSPSSSDRKNPIYEPKLLHSNFYQPKVVYDSFSKVFHLENVNPAAVQSEEINIKYKPSRVFNSSFMFTFPEYITFGRSTQDYDNILVVNRNNEMPIYNNAYLNYVRNGYNYDVKNKNQREGMNWLGTGLSVLGAVAAPVTGGTSLIGAGLAISAVSSISRNISSSIDAERNIEQKLADARNQATSVSNCDDIDLLQEYSGNKAKLMIYQASGKVRKNLFDLFYYTGYNVGTKKVPDFNTRYWFNFIQANPVFEEDIHIYADFLENFKERFRRGVTIYHEHNGVYDWEQSYENWESWLLS